ncbi:Nramp family divalent metal transporter [candidate division WWE3 bacterium]|uniref:Nramp family divalent metal transporter n=1 Tax=candidate division WWE3 bacterium TaxID=2053526 RepID=A0A955RPS2_UNCKA|nr:Nramp family divalent metal transporter [candidate division WWE3 bacterium]
MALEPLKVNQLPKALSLRKIIGPSFIILGLGLGSGEVILWPYLTSNFGMGVIWGALLGLSFQFIMNMEIERYALAHGESIFVGFARKLRWLPIWFIFSTFLPWIWPGIAASSATLVGHLVGFEQTHYIAIGFLILMGLILSLGPVLYKTVETFEKVLIILGVPSIFVISVILAERADWIAAAKGIVGIGEGFSFLPAAIPMATFLGALAYAGAGGNLNLAQSYYVKEKGYGMGKFAGRITSLFTGKKDEEEISLTGTAFEPTEENLSEFKKWWRNINIEHFVVFWGTGSITIVLLALLSYTTTFGKGADTASISFVISEAQAIGELLIPAVGTFFLIVASLTLFGTQLTVFDATSRILSENIILALPSKLRSSDIPRMYYFVLWSLIGSGILILLLGFTQPLVLLTTAAVLNAMAMFVHVGLTLWMNMTLLKKEIRPSALRILLMVAAFLFYGGFSGFVLVDQLQKFF